MPDFKKPLINQTKLESSILFGDCKDVVAQLAKDNDLTDGQILCFLVSFCASEIIRSVAGTEAKLSMRKCLADQILTFPIGED